MEITAQTIATGTVLAAMIGGVVFMLRRAGTEIGRLLWRQFTIQVEITDRDDAFWWAIKWLSRHPYSQKANRLVASNASRNTIYSPSDEQAKKSVALSPGIGFHLLFHAGKPIFLRRTRAEPAGGKSLGGPPPETITLTVFGRERSPLIALLNEIERSANEDASNTVTIWANNSDCWYQVAIKPKRDISTVVLRDGVTESIIADLERFAASEKWYADRGVPYRRGYALYGEPGTGKSSLITAIASHFDRSLAVLSLPAVYSDSTLLQLIQRAPSDAIVVIEDIDAAFVGREKQSESSLTFSGLLNAIDGVASQDGRILIITTNHLDKLDEALVRPGRIDVPLYLGHVDADQARRLFLRFFPGEEALAAQFANAIPERSVVPAAVQGLLLKHAHDPAVAVATARETWTVVP